MSLKRPPHFDLSGIALLLDVDGTLLDIAPRPDDVHVPEVLKTALTELAVGTDGALALISGRPLAELDTLFAPLHLAAAGCHGAEIRFEPLGAISHRAPLSAAVKAEFAEIANRFPGVFLEDKHYSIALHYRDVPSDGDAVVAAARHAAGGFADLECLPGKAVVEVKEAGYDKGTAFAALLKAPPFAGRKPVFLGDDVTDEAVFARLADYDGAGIAIGRRIRGAQYYFDTPSDVRGWLGALTGEAVGEP